MVGSEGSCPCLQGFVLVPLCGSYHTLVTSNRFLDAVNSLRNLSFKIVYPNLSCVKSQHTSGLLKQE